MNTSKIIRGIASGRGYSVTSPIIKEDYGLYLKIEGIELPPTYEVDFSNSEHDGTSVTMIGNSDGVLIPHQFIDTGKDIFAFLYHVGEDFGRTVYKFRIPNKVRPDRTEEQPTPEEQSVIDQTISALNDAVDKTAQDVIDADASAQASAESAQASGESALSASNSALSSSEYASNALSHAESASASATASAQSAQSAEQSAQTASAKADAITGLTAQATTLPEGSSATASYSDGTLTLGIPKGDKGEKGDRGEQGIQGERGLTGAKGDKGDKGDTGAQGIQGERGLTGESGVYIGDTEPTDERIKVWIDTSDTSPDKSSPIVGIGQAGYMKVKG